MSQRLDVALVERNLVSTRSQAESYIKLGQVKVNGKIIEKPGFALSNTDKVELLALVQYVSRAALKLASIAADLELHFKDKIVLDVGSSTGGFTDFALKHGAQKVIAVDVGSNQLHPKLRENEKIELHEQTDIRHLTSLSSVPDIVVIDVSFISLRQVLPAVSVLSAPNTQIVAMVKPQFETDATKLKHKGIIKNEQMRRQILKDFEVWVKSRFKIIHKADSKVSGEKGNVERFYVLQKLSSNINHITDF